MTDDPDATPVPPTPDAPTEGGGDADRPEPATPLDPFAAWHGVDDPPSSTSMTRLRDRAGRVIAGLLALLLVLPVGAWMIDALVFRQQGGEVAEAVPALADAVALVTVGGCDGSGGSGSGFALHLQGFDVVVTNRHVVEGAASVGLRTLDGGLGPTVERVLVSTTRDVAALVLSEPLGSDLRLARSPLVGDEVRLVGFPGARPVTSAGTVTAVDTERALLSMTVDPGASGAPVVDEDGAVVAQIVARTGDGTGVAIPVDAVAQGLSTLVPLPGC